MTEERFEQIVDETLNQIREILMSVNELLD